MIKQKKIHCPNCHKNIIPIQWLCGCIRCPKCSHVFKSCLPKLGKRKIGTCKVCGKPIWETYTHFLSEDSYDYQKWGISY